MTYRSASFFVSALGVLLAYGCSSSSSGTKLGGSTTVCECAVTDNDVSASLDCGTSQCVNGTTYTCGATAGLSSGGSCEVGTGGDDGGQSSDDGGESDDATKGGDDGGSGDDGGNEDDASSGDAGGSGDDGGSGGDDASQGGDDAGSGGCTEVSCETNADCQTVSAGMVCLQLNSATPSYACFFASPFDNCNDPGDVPTEVTCGGSSQYACVPGSCLEVSQLPAGDQQETSDGECGE